ncbi:MAG: lipopolysaccharide heptosyltransferase II [Planctomycetota bacterium]|nr:lipopolysaccharide heptosyltransferase II [Planctomycetota bacterium]
MKVLVRMPNWLGDCVMALWALRDALSQSDVDRVDVLCRKSVAGLMNCIPFVGTVHTIEKLSGFKGLLGNRARLRELSMLSYDIGLLLPNSISSALEMRTARPSKLVGYSTDGRGMLLDRPVRVQKWLKEAHMYSYYLNVALCAFGADELEEEAPVPKEKFELSFTDSDIQLIEQLLVRHSVGERYIVVGPGAAFGPSKQWKPDSYAGTVDLICRKYDCSAVIAGAPSDRKVAHEIASRIEAESADLCGTTDLPQVTYLLSRSFGFVGNDSGLMHVAALAGTPCVGLFFSTEPVRTSPIGLSTRCVEADIACRPCYRRECNRGYECRDRVSPSQISEAFGNTLASADGR